MHPHLRSEGLPGFAQPQDVGRAAFPALRPPRRISVSESAEKWRVLKNPGGGYSGPWLNSFAPYLTEPMDAFQRRDVGEVVVLGPSQFGKSEIIINLIVHEAAEGGADTLLFQPTKALALDFAERRIEKAFDASDRLKALLGPDRSDDKRMSKLFRNGSRASMGYPVSGELSSRPVPKVLLDELDSMDEDIDGEGDPVELARARTTTFGRHAKVGVFSTPKRQDGSGIVARWRNGDRRLWHWPCPHCGEYFTPGFDENRRPTVAHLHVRPKATEEEARAEVHMICPTSGCIIEERHKIAMNARGVWLPEGATIAADGTIGGTPLRSRVASYWFSGFAARQRPWADMAAQYVAALRALEERQDEEPLRTHWNTRIGAPYRSVLGAAAPLEPEELRKRAEALELRVVPGWAGFVTTAVDVQGNRNDCQSVAWGADGRSQVIDAWQIFQTEAGDRMLEPARHGEDWDLLTTQVLRKAWRGVDGTEFRSHRISVDTGDGNVTGNAYAWWHRLDREDQRRVMLLKGDGRRDAPLLSPRKIETDRRGRRMKRGIIVTHVNVEVLKDQVDLKLRMTRPGPGWVHLPASLPERFWEEATAEFRGKKGWEKQRARNESFDLLVYNLAIWHALGGPRLDWARPADWHRPRAGLLLLDLATSAPPGPMPVMAAKPPVQARPAVPGTKTGRWWKPAARLIGRLARPF
jgi:phage terminase large subunit GpA-like protein